MNRITLGVIDGLQTFGIILLMFMLARTWNADPSLGVLLGIVGTCAIQIVHHLLWDFLSDEFAIIVRGHWRDADE